MHLQTVFRFACHNNLVACVYSPPSAPNTVKCNDLNNTATIGDLDTTQCFVTPKSVVLTDIKNLSGKFNCTGTVTRIWTITSAFGVQVVNTTYNVIGMEHEQEFTVRSLST